MDDFTEKQEITDEAPANEQEESTVFSAPPEHKKEKLKSSKKRTVLSIVAAVLAVCVLVGGTLAVIKFIPKLKKDDDTASTPKTETLNVSNYGDAVDKFDSVTVKNKNGEFSFYPKAGESGEEMQWYVKGVDESKISVYKTEDIISSAASLRAILEIDKKTREDCGLDTPVTTVSVASKSLGDFTLLIGELSPDKTGVYLYSSIDEKIYLVSESEVSEFEFTLLDLANTDSVPPVTSLADMGDYAQSGTLMTFDSLTVSGSKFMHPISIRQISEEDVSKVGFAYRIVSPISRYGSQQSIDSVLTAFSSGISVSGVYSLDTDAAVLKEFGLNNPDVVLTLHANGVSFIYLFALQEDGNYALFGDGMNTVKMISPSAAEYLSLNEDDFYNKSVYIRYIAELKNMTFNSAQGVYSFDISENPEDAQEQFDISLGDKHIDSENFQNFYMEFVSMSLVDFSTEAVGESELTVKILDVDGKIETLEFFRSSATEVCCSYNGEMLGRITSATYNKLLSNIKTVSENKNVEN